MEYYGNNDWRDYHLAHYGKKGMKWGKKKKQIQNFIDYNITGKGYIRDANSALGYRTNKNGSMNLDRNPDGYYTRGEKEQYLSERSKKSAVTNGKWDPQKSFEKKRDAYRAGRIRGDLDRMKAKSVRATRDYYNKSLFGRVKSAAGKIKKPKLTWE